MKLSIQPGLTTTRLPVSTLWIRGICKLFLIALLCLPVFLTSAGAAQSPERQNEPFVVVVNDAPPFRIIESWEGQEGYSGAYIDMINEISLRTGIPLRFHSVPFARALVMMEEGTADMMLGPNWSIDRAEYMLYLKAAFPAETKVFYLSDQAPDITRYSDIKNQKIGVLRGVRYFDPFDQDAGINKEVVNDYEQAFKMLNRNRLDALIIPERQGAFLQRRLGYAFRTSSFRVPGKASFITLSRKSALIQDKDKIETVMSDLNGEGYFERLMLLYLK